jgi:membrane protein implicated in regulation of membrane protease activity
MDQLFSHVVYWTWWIIGIFLVILEISAPGTYFLWMGISAGIVGVILYIVPELAWELQLTIFAVLSVVTVLISRKYLQKNGEDQSTLSQRGKRYIGMTVVVEEPIENDIGKVRIEDTLWRAAGQDAPKGNKVRIIGIDGATFQVERVSAE